MAMGELEAEGVGVGQGQGMSHHSCALFFDVLSHIIIYYALNDLFFKFIGTLALE
jgi:hypothetical protein